MKDYSQNGEQKIILEYFKEWQPAMFLDIGANDGMTLSNSRALFERGWVGVLIEPAPSVFPLLQRNIERSLSMAYNCAIGPQTGKMILHESDSHLVNGDNNNLALLSSLNPAELTRWGNTQTFTPVEVDVFTWEDFKENALLPQYFDFITIDAEGLDYEILKQIDLSKVCMVCIEWNAKEEILRKITDYCVSFGMKQHHRNYENVIFVK